MNQIIIEQLREAQSVLDGFIRDQNNIEKIEEAARLLTACIDNGGKVISCGNGGSHADAMHFAEELTGRFRENRLPLPAIAIADPTHITCVGNDFGYDQVFSRFVEGLGSEKDVLLGISTSGNSINVIRAAETARSKGMKVIALTGKDGGQLANLADVEIRVGHFGYADRVQEIHMNIIHIIILLIEKYLS